MSTKKLEFFSSEKGKSLPLTLSEDKVSAGFTSLIESSFHKIDLNEHLITHPAATFFVRVHGDSMEGAGIFSNDLLIVDRAKKAISNHIIVAFYQGEFTVKRFKQDKKGISLHPENPHYPILHLRQGEDFLIWGVVTYVIHSFV